MWASCGAQVVLTQLRKSPADWKAAKRALERHLADAGEFDYSEPVAALWPPFGAAGKGGVSVADALAHRAGVPRTGASAAAFIRLFRAKDGNPEPCNTNPMQGTVCGTSGVLSDLAYPIVFESTPTKFG